MPELFFFLNSFSFFNFDGRLLLLARLCVFKEPRVYVCKDVLVNMNEQSKFFAKCFLKICL